MSHSVPAAEAERQEAVVPEVAEDIPVAAVELEELAARAGQVEPEAKAEPGAPEELEEQAAKAARAERAAEPPDAAAAE